MDDDDCSTAAHLAAKAGNMKTLKKLIQWGAKLDDLDAKGWNPFLLALSNGKTGVALDLIPSGKVDVNASGGPDNRTALMIACSLPKDSGAEVVKLLLEYGARIDLTDKEGKTALQLASAAGNERCLKLLSGASLDEKLSKDPAKKGWDVLELEVEKGVDADEQSAVEGFDNENLTTSEAELPSLQEKVSSQDIDNNASLSREQLQIMLDKEKLNSSSLEEDLQHLQEEFNTLQKQLVEAQRLAEKYKSLVESEKQDHDESSHEKPQLKIETKPRPSMNAGEKLELQRLRQEVLVLESALERAEDKSKETSIRCHELENEINLLRQIKSPTPNVSSLPMSRTSENINFEPKADEKDLDFSSEEGEFSDGSLNFSDDEGDVLDLMDSKADKGDKDTEAKGDVFGLVDEDMDEGTVDQADKGTEGKGDVLGLVDSKVDQGDEDNADEGEQLKTLRVEFVKLQEKSREWDKERVEAKLKLDALQKELADTKNQVVNMPAEILELTSSLGKKNKELEKLKEELREKETEKKDKVTLSQELVQAHEEIARLEQIASEKANNDAETPRTKDQERNLKSIPLGKSRIPTRSSAAASLI
eukprot:UC4_evm1s1268